jgi:hypothetical protein
MQNIKPMKRSLLCLLFLLLVCGGQIRAVDVSAPAAASKSAKPWNFVVILLDDAGWRDLGFTGNRYIETPNMDRLAERGMTFANAYATHPFCSPTRQSMITGQWPARTAWVQKSEIGDLKAARMAPEFCPAGTFQWTERRPVAGELARPVLASPPAQHDRQVGHPCWSRLLRPHKQLFPHRSGQDGTNLREFTLARLTKAWQGLREDHEINTL